MEDKKDVCEVRVIGTVAKKFDLKKSQGGVSWIGFSIKSEINGFKSYNTFTSYKEIAEDFDKKVKEGDRVAIFGNCRSSKNSKTNYWEESLTAYKFEVISSASDNIQQGNEVPTSTPTPNANAVPKSADDLPF